MMFFVLFLLALAAAGGGRIYWLGRRVVPVDHVGIVRQVWGRPHSDRRYRNVVPGSARGIHAGTLLAQRPAFLMPWLYTVETVPRIRVPEGSIGVVVAREGRKRPGDRPVAILPEGVDCDHFQDAAAFLLGGGEEGPQAMTLAGGTSYDINTVLFEVRIVPRTYVPDGTVGVVMAKAGGIREPGQAFACHVPCRDFQDGTAFLRGGGEQGRQLAVLAGGTYYDINPELFEVLTTTNVGEGREGLAAVQLKLTSIPVGHAGVVITRDGAEPEDEETVGPVVKGHGNFRLPWVFLAAGGRRGVQQETLAQGSKYALNPWFVEVLLVPTFLLNMEWNKKDPAKKGNYDARLHELDLETSQGIRLRVEVSQSLRIPPDAAPKLVSKFGSSPDSGRLAGGALTDDPQPVQRFVERVLGATVETYLVENAASVTVKDFLTGVRLIRASLDSQVSTTLAKWGVEAERTNIERVTPLDQVYYDERRKVFVEDTRGDVLDRKKEHAEAESEIALKEIEIEKRRYIAEAEAEAELLGLDHVRLTRMIQAMSKLPVPQFLGGDLSGYLESMPTSVVRGLLEQLGALKGRKAITPGSGVPHVLEIDGRPVGQAGLPAGDGHSGEGEATEDGPADDASARRREPWTAEVGGDESEWTG
ncbi:SPFH domain-containing protein [Actinomadura graeca]|uniref:SPFH domain-containing protein n=1 Tax=Actinomadura graeca TaxID=2750812 RepID=A0ABX8QU77_9ACTN|nr:SPFH domain-containing protein [Actinomadura graeca]QXJ22364.1 SPFH domain-containing protein [Actinomadura graeca]